MVKYSVAITMGYSNHGFSNGRVIYENKSVEFISKEWIKGKAIIELSSKLFIALISITGLSILYYRNYLSNQYFNNIDWIILFFTLYIWKPILLAIIFLLRKSVFCDIGMFAEYFNLSLFWTECVILLVGLIITFWAFRIIPRNHFKEVITIIFFAGILTSIIWIKIIGVLIFT